MSQHEESSGAVSRRHFLSVAAVAAGALVAVGVSKPAVAASAQQKKKFSQQQAKYQPIPKNGQRCQACALWQAPTSCQVVDGQVSPAGWCILYQAKA